jgi:hypothetical protein
MATESLSATVHIDAVRWRMPGGTILGIIPVRVSGKLSRDDVTKALLHIFRGEGRLLSSYTLYADLTGEQLNVCVYPRERARFGGEDIVQVRERFPVTVDSHIRFFPRGGRWEMNAR